MMITILGLGPGNPQHLTQEAWEVLSQAREVYLRTSRHPTVAALPTHLALHSFDELYETLSDFATVYETIAERIVDLGRQLPGVVYAVPGHPLVGESSVMLVLARAREEGVPVRLVAGLSYIEPVLAVLELDGMEGLQLADAVELAALHHPSLDPDRPALIGQLYGQRLASEVKLTLLNAYPAEHPVTLVRAAGTADSAVHTVALHELDHGQKVDHLTTLYVPQLPEPGGLASFQETVARLRAPDGCPWDREQTHQSLRATLLEETYEALAALDEEDDDKLCEELGDVLMQVAMHVQIATEEGTFQFADVIGRIDAKLKRRHPHVFGDLIVQDSAEVLSNWEMIKEQERSSSGGESVHRSRLDSVPGILPALARAQALSDRAARVGFDWTDVDGVLDKVAEEVAELRDVLAPEARARELGDLLFSIVNVARWLDIDAETALRGTCDRFIGRYATMEHMARARGVDLTDLSLAEQDALWEQSKRDEADLGWELSS
ncbi:MAG: nucleoside triphosphate pyrophosphohydrolase [Anaerolineae bacterium]|jgi:tetrapyrrole methylase family protein/MazG family protein